MYINCEVGRERTKIYTGNWDGNKGGGIKWEEWSLCLHVLVKPAAFFSEWAGVFRKVSR